MVARDKPAQERRDSDRRVRRGLRLGRPRAPDLDRRHHAGRAIDEALQNWLLEHLDGDGRRVGHGYQAIVRQLSSPVGELVVKSPHPSSLLAWLGRRAIRREARAYERLASIAGVPRCFGLAAGKHLALEHVAGPTLRQAAAGLDNRDRFFTRLLATIRAMHAAGVAHGDLKRKENTLVGPDESPCIIDFGIAVMRTEQAGWWHRKRFEIVRQMDLNAWIKLKHGPNTANLPPAEAALYHPLMIERWARRARGPWKWLTLRSLRKRRRSNSDGGA